MSEKHLETSANPAARYSPTILLLLFSCPFVYVVRDTVMMFLAGEVQIKARQRPWTLA